MFLPSSCPPCGPDRPTSPPWHAIFSIASPDKWTIASRASVPKRWTCSTAYDWPGNVRELSNAIERAMVVGTPPMIRPEDLPLRPPPGNGTAVGESLAEMERRHIAAVLEHTGGNVTQAAAILKIDRVTVYNKIKKYGLRGSGE